MAKFPMPRLGLADDLTAAKPALRDCLEAVLLQSDVLLEGVIVGLTASQTQTKGRAAHINQNPANKRAIEHLSRHAQKVKDTFSEELRKALYTSGSHEHPARLLLRFDDFQFLEEKQIDANIESALTQQEIAQAVDDVLPTLNAMVSSLLGLVSVQSQLNPMKPEAFVLALRECLAKHVKDDSVRAALITPAAGLLGIALRQLYKDVSDWLRSRGVEPALPAGASLGAGGASGAKAPETSVSRTLLTLDKLRRLLSGDLDIGFNLGSSGPKDFLHTVPASFVALEDLKLVEPMMQRLAKRAKQPDAATPRATVDMLASAETVAHERAQGKQLGRQLGEEVVRLMLENLMKDQRLLPRVRDMIKELEPVLLQLSQSDPRFFSERQHPARQLLDRVTHRSLAFSSENDEGFGRFSKLIANSVRVLSGGVGDEASFARVLRKLEEGWEREEDAQRKSHEEAARALLHAEQRNLLAQRFAEDFHQRIKGKDVPDLISAFLRGPWAQVMAESQLNCTDGTADPEGYRALVDDLIWSVQLRLARRNRPRLVALVPNLLIKLRQGLQLVGYPEERIPVFFDELITLHEKAFEGPRAIVQEVEKSDGPALADTSAAEGTSAFGESEPGSEGSDADDADEMVALKPEAFWVGEQEATDSGYLADDIDLEIDLPQGFVKQEDGEPNLWSVADLNTGAWVEIMLNGVWIRAQLTWASPHRTLFMFVSGRGLAHSMSRRTIDRRRASGLIRLVSDGNVVGSALDGVAQTALRNNRDQPDAT